MSILEEICSNFCFDCNKSYLFSCSLDLQMWMHADQRQTGFLGRPEFYNALRLVAVAQCKRELTPEIVKAALYGPAAAKIPPPKINLPVNPAPYSSAESVASGTQMALSALTPSPAPNATENQSYFPSQQTQSSDRPKACRLLLQLIHCNQIQLQHFLGEVVCWDLVFPMLMFPAIGPVGCLVELQVRLQG